MMKKLIAGSNTKGTWIPRMTSLVNSSQEKDAGILYFQNYSIYQLALALDVIQVIDGMDSC